MVPNTASKQPSSTETYGKMNNDPILEEYCDVFIGLGCLPGEYSIQCDRWHTRDPPTTKGTSCNTRSNQRRVGQNGEGVVEPVTEPTPWVSSMVAVRKKNNKVRICIDSRDLNQAIKRAHFPLSTIEDIATRLTGAKVFSVLDARTGFWQVKLDTRSSYLTTFNTPFGRYRWMRMPFGITSAPEVWQQRMQEITEGLKGVEVIAADFLIIGRGETQEAAMTDHDQNLRKFLNRARERNLKLSLEKARLRLTEVTYVGHRITAEGLLQTPASSGVATTGAPGASPRKIFAITSLAGRAWRT